MVSRGTSNIDVFADAVVGPGLRVAGWWIGRVGEGLKSILRGAADGVAAFAFTS